MESAKVIDTSQKDVIASDSSDSCIVTDKSLLNYSVLLRDGIFDLPIEVASKELKRRAYRVVEAQVKQSEIPIS